MLPNDISRCAGASAAGRTCEHRETCRRFTEPPVTPGWAWYIHPQIPGPCAYYMPTPARSAPNPSSGEGPSTPDRTIDVTHPHPSEGRP